MRLIIAGSRSIKRYAILLSAIQESGLWAGYKRSIEVVSGEADGVDSLGEEFAKRNKLKLHARPADWDNIKAPGAVVRHVKFGKNKGKAYNALAGHWRNEEMAKFADEALVVWDGESTGSLDMIDRMVQYGKPVYLYPLRISADLLAEMEAKGVNVIYPNLKTQ